jgi:hypothetical protein
MGTRKGFTGVMQNKSDKNERRRHTRYRVREGAYAALSPDFGKMGQIIDISRGGLCFRYIASLDHQAMEDCVESHVFVGDEGIYLEKMPNHLVEDVTVEDDDVPSSIMMSPRAMRVVRQRRVRFGELNGNQAAQLDYFIMNRTTGRV